MRLALTITLSIVVLAGCGGAPVGDSTSTTSTAELASYPGGLSESGIQGAYELANTHQAALDDQPFTREHQLRIVAANGTTLVNESTTATFRANRSWFRYHTEVDTAPWGIFGAANGSLTAYGNGSVVALYQESPNDEEKAPWFASEPTGELTHPSEFWLTEQPTAHRQIAARYQAIRPADVSRTSSGFLIESDQLDAAQIEFENLPVTNVTDVSFTANLTAEGRVESYHIEVTGELSETQVTARESVSFSEVGSAEVDAPTWFT